MPNWLHLLWLSVAVCSAIVIVFPRRPIWMKRPAVLAEVARLRAEREARQGLTVDRVDRVVEAILTDANNTPDERLRAAALWYKRFGYLEPLARRELVAALTDDQLREAAGPREINN